MCMHMPVEAQGWPIPSVVLPYSMRQALKVNSKLTNMTRLAIQPLSLLSEFHAYPVFM